MKNIVLLMVLLLISILSQAQQKVIPLYEGIAPGTETWNWTEAVNDNNSWNTKVVYNVTQPSLTVFQPAPGKVRP
jgi:hypothetical protein